MEKLNTLVCISVLCLAAAPLYATETQPQQAKGIQSQQTTETQSKQATETRSQQGADTGAMLGKQQNTRETVREAARVFEQIKAEAGLRTALLRAKGVYIVPDYDSAFPALGVAGGQGVLMVNREGEWFGPAFFTIGTPNLGVTAGAEAGAIVFLIMSDKAMQGFRSGASNFPLNADAGLTLIDWTATGRVSAGKDVDVIAWSDTEALYGDLATSASNIFWDDGANQAYYDRSDLAINDILQGDVRDTEASSPLKAEFSALEKARSK